MIIVFIYSFVIPMLYHTAISILEGIIMLYRTFEELEIDESNSDSDSISDELLIPESDSDDSSIDGDAIVASHRSQSPLLSSGEEYTRSRIQQLIERRLLHLYEHLETYILMYNRANGLEESQIRVPGTIMAFLPRREINLIVSSLWYYRYALEHHSSPLTASVEHDFEEHVIEPVGNGASWSRIFGILRNVHSLLLQARIELILVGLDGGALRGFYASRRPSVADRIVQEDLHFLILNPAARRESGSVISGSHSSRPQQSMHRFHGNIPYAFGNGVNPFSYRQRVERDSDSSASESEGDGEQINGPHAEDHVQLPPAVPPHSNHVPAPSLRSLWGSIMGFIGNNSNYILLVTGGILVAATILGRNNRGLGPR